MRSPARLTALSTVAIAALLTVFGGNAAAHSDGGSMQIITLEQTGPLTVTIEAGVTFANDGHLAADAAVQATLSGPGGESIGPIALQGGGEGSGLYLAEVVLPAPGPWSAEVTSSNPSARADGEVQVSAEAGGTPDVPPGAVTDQPVDPEVSTLDAPTATAPAGGSDVDDIAEGRAVDGDGDTAEDRSIGIIVIAVGVVVVIAGAVFAISRRKQTALQADGDSDVEID